MHLHARNLHFGFPTFPFRIGVKNHASIHPSIDAYLFRKVPEGDSSSSVITIKAATVVKKLQSVKIRKQNKLISTSRKSKKKLQVIASCVLLLIEGRMMNLKTDSKLIQKEGEKAMSKVRNLQRLQKAVSTDENAAEAELTSYAAEAELTSYAAEAELTSYAAEAELTSYAVN